VRYFLELCIKSVQAALVNIDAEIIVVDNNSQDDSCKMVKTLFPDVILIENNDNTGFSKGNNIGVTKAQGEYVCILNPDTVIAEDTFEKLFLLADSRDNLGILCCRLIDGSGDFLPESKRNLPTPKVAFRKIIGLSNTYYCSQVSQRGMGVIPVCVGAFMVIKRGVYNEVNGFDEDYFMYGEDIDLSYKITKAGYENVYQGAVTAIHFKGESTPKDKIFRKRFYDAMRIFYKKHFKKSIIFDLMVSIGSKMIHLIEGKKSAGILPEGQEVVFDSNHMSYKEIIAAFENKSGVFMIRPKNANFIIGSSSSKLKGDVRVVS